MKKVWSSLLVLLLALIGLNVTDVKASTQISLNTEYEGSLDTQTKENYYNFSLSESGQVKIDVESFVSSSIYYQFLNDGELIESDYINGSEANPGKDTLIYDLEPGNYTLRFYARYDGNAGDYNFTVGFSPSSSEDKEPNNGVAQAEPITFGKKKLGYLSWNDGEDYHKFTLDRAAIVSMDIEGYISSDTHYAVYDSNNAVINSDYYSSSPQNPSKIAKTYYLEPGDYYIRIYSRYDGYTGKYQLTVNKQDADANEAESNNGTALAQSIEFGETAKGFISWNDTDDYFSFKVNKKKDYILVVNGKLKNDTHVQVIDDKNNIVWSDYYSSSAANPAVIEKKLTLEPGKYYVRIYARYDGYYGEYDVTVTGDGITAFKDYQRGAYWTNSFAWGMKNSVIKGDLKSNRLNPNNHITEAQWLAMLLRYAHNLKDSTSGNWYDSYYQKARQLGMATNGEPNSALTRGAVARMLMTVHEGKSVTEREAVQWLYEKEITTGVKPSVGPTYENFNPTGKLTRAHAITFMYRLYVQ